MRARNDTLWVSVALMHIATKIQLNVRVFYRFVMAELYVNHLSFIAGRSCDQNWVVTFGQGHHPVWVT